MACCGEQGGDQDRLAGTTSMSYLGVGSSLASDGTSLYTYDLSGTMTAEGPAPAALGTR
jgi:hypothetical protein